MVKQNKRIEWIDTLRAIAIILVVFGHFYSNNYLFFLLTSPIKIPLFFVITGFLFKKKNFSDFNNSMFHNIIIPWLVLTIPIYVLKLIIHPSISIFIKDIFNLIIGQKGWYIPCLIVSEYLYYFINKIKTKEQIKIAVVLFCVIIGLLLKDYLGIISVSLVSQLFIYFGNVIKTNSKRLMPSIKTKEYRYILIISSSLYLLLCFISYIFYNNMVLDVHHNQYYNYPICFSLIGLGVLFFFNNISNMKQFKLMTLIGKNTLYIYILHGYISSLLSKLENYVNVDTLFMNNILVVSLVKTIITIAISIIITIIIKKFLPVIFDYRNLKKE